MGEIFAKTHEFDGFTGPTCSPAWRDVPLVPGRYIRTQFFSVDKTDQFSGTPIMSPDIIDVVFGVNGPELVEHNGVRPLRDWNGNTSRYFGPIHQDPRVKDKKLT